MQVQVNKLSPVLIEFDVEVAADRVTTEMEKAYTAVSRSARIRGFRPGKAPRGVLKNMFGARIAADVAQRLVDETFPEAVSAQKVQPVSSPAIEPQKVEENKPFSYKARFEVVPEIESVNYDALEAKRPKVEVTDEQVNEALENLRLEHSTLEPLKTERPAQKGDLVTIDFTIEVDGAVIEDAGANDFPAELGAGVLLAPIDEALMGKKVGEQAEASLEMPAQHPHPKLKGKKAVFKLSLKELKERVLPALDDELAKDVGEFETLADLKKDVTARIEKQLKEHSDNAVAEQLVVELVKANPIPLPPSLVERQMQLTQQEILSQARRQGQSVSGLGDELRQRVQADSEVKVRAGLLMAEIAKKENIKIGDTEIEEGLAELAEQSGKNVAKLRAEYRDQKKREMLIGMILENKVLDIIEAKAKIEDVTPEEKK
jgi:trigger factor